MDRAGRPDPLRERFLRAFLDWVMLSIIERKPTFGYEMITTITGEFGVYISPGTLYPILSNLEQSGYIEGAWDPPESKFKKIYRITPEGTKSLQDGLDHIGAVISSLRRNNGGQHE